MRYTRPNAARVARRSDIPNGQMERIPPGAVRPLRWCRSSEVRRAHANIQALSVPSGEGLTFRGTAHIDSDYAAEVSADRTTLHLPNNHPPGVLSFGRSAAITVTRVSCSVASSDRTAMQKMKRQHQHALLGPGLDQDAFDTGERAAGNAGTLPLFQVGIRQAPAAARRSPFRSPASLRQESSSGDPSARRAGRPGL